MTKLEPGKARYALACDDRGGSVMDGDRHPLERRSLLVRPRRTVSSSPGSRPHARGLDVVISDPRSLGDADPGADIAGRSCGRVQRAPRPVSRTSPSPRWTMGGQDVLVSRTGWSGELGFEIYTRAENGCPRPLGPRRRDRSGARARGAEPRVARDPPDRGGDPRQRHGRRSDADAVRSGPRCVRRPRQGELRGQGGVGRGRSTAAPLRGQRARRRRSRTTASSSATTTSVA